MQCIHNRKNRPKMCRNHTLTRVWPFGGYSFWAPGYQGQAKTGLSLFRLILRHQEGLPTNIGVILTQKYLYTFSWRKVSSTKARFDEYFLKIIYKQHNGNIFLLFIHRYIFDILFFYKLIKYMNLHHSVI